MSSRPSALITAGPSRLGVVPADYTSRRANAPPVVQNRTRIRPPFQRRLRLTDEGPTNHENDIRLEERCKERARIAYELHDTLLQGFVGASMLLDQAVEQTPSDLPSKAALSRALYMVRRAIEEGREVLQGLPTATTALSTLEQAFSKLLDEVTPGRGVQPQVVVQGRARALKPTIQEQLFLIGREAIINALLHSEATKIEVEIQYLRDLLRVLVRDNGCGIMPEAVQKAGNSHWGLRGMRDRADKIGALFVLRSRPSAGTEVSITLPVEAQN